MVQEAVEGVPQRGLLLRRAHELLESIGQPTSETLLIQHLLEALLMPAAPPPSGHSCCAKPCKVQHFLNRSMNTSGPFLPGAARKCSSASLNLSSLILRPRVCVPAPTVLLR